LAEFSLERFSRLASDSLAYAVNGKAQMSPAGS
jgi:hypothetical protein